MHAHFKLQDPRPMTQGSTSHAPWAREGSSHCVLPRSFARTINKYGTPQRHNASAPMASPRAKGQARLGLLSGCGVRDSENLEGRLSGPQMHRLHASHKYVRSAGSPEDELYKARTYTVIDELILAFFARRSLEDRGSPVGCLQKDRRTEAFRIPYSETRIPALARAIGSQGSTIRLRAAR